MSHYICTVTVNSGASNYPTLEADGDIVLIYKAPYKLLGTPYEVGDVVMAISPIEPFKSNKRIILLIISLMALFVFILIKKLVSEYGQSKGIV